MDLDGGEAVLEVDLFDSRLAHEFFEFAEQIFTECLYAHIGEIDICFFHCFLRIRKRRIDPLQNQCGGFCYMESVCFLCG